MAPKPVVVGVDGSEGSLRALEWAALEAQRRGSPLRIVSVPAMPARMHPGDGPTQTVASELEEFYERALGAAITRSQEIAPGLLIDTDLLSGPPAVAIAEAGAGALMIVVGARGIGGFTAMLLGSVSRYVATHAPCPAVVVREQSDAVHGEIVVGVRDPHEITEALSFAFEEAALRSADLVAVHTWHTFLQAHGGTEDATGDAADSESAETGSMLGEALREWRDKYPAVTLRQDVVRGHPAQVLAGYSARADLVVIGRHGASGSGPAIGSTQHAVLNHARGPVAIVPNAD